MARTRARRAVEREDQKSVSAYTRNRLLIFAAAQVLVVALGVFVQFRLPQQAGTRSPEPSPCGLLGNRTRYFVFSRRVVTPRGTFPATVGVDGGRIVSVDKGRREDLEASDLVLDYGDLVVSPGLVDLHVHVNEPGRESWEGFSTATAAAAAGGVTTLFDMPLNSEPAATTTKILREKMAVAKDKIRVDVGFWGGLVPENAGAGGGSQRELLGMLEAGAVGFKAFMSPSGIEDFGNADEADLTAGLRVLSRFSKPLMVHAELPFDVDLGSKSPRKYDTYAGSRPGKFEEDAIRQLLGISKALAGEGVPHKIHVAHVAQASILDEVQIYKNKNLRSFEVSFTTETCPHYIFFQSEEVPDGATQYKCAPPIRNKENKEALLRQLKRGTINTIGSDHSPSPPDLKFLKEGDFLRAWGGIAGLQYSLPASWTAASEHGATIEDMAEWWSSAPAAVAGLTDRGSIEVGKKADLVVWNEKALAETGKGQLFHKHKLSPYNDRKMKGRVEASIVSGHLVFSKGQLSQDVCGRIVRT
ncbi:allantoinase [Chloropicon primus]|uniref:allantoinase n=2 Tax=Chloropicon primus TaxID=1764295 RepID=A0A5B8MMU4_9CHLO|nr:allantoinase [Chloropicon primus]UPQ99884.1 allantoinase [Chloropicon primus]|eukprot:QDZ20672.1 allantoinase [Chloropicon primus]